MISFQMDWLEPLAVQGTLKSLHSSKASILWFSAFFMVQFSYPYLITGKTMCVLVTELCPTLCDPMNCSLPGFSFHGILQVRILEWIAIPFSRGSSRPRDGTLVSCITGRFFHFLSYREVIVSP